MGNFVCLRSQSTYTPSQCIGSAGFHILKKFCVAFAGGSTIIIIMQRAGSILAEHLVKNFNNNNINNVKVNYN